MKHHIGAVVAAVTGAVIGVVVVVYMAVSGIISIHFSNEKWHPGVDQMAFRQGYGM